MVFEAITNRASHVTSSQYYSLDNESCTYKSILAVATPRWSDTTIEDREMMSLMYLRNIVWRLVFDNTFH